MNTLTQTRDAAADRITATTAAREEASMLPAVDVIEDASGITLYADLPGVPKDKLQLRVEGDQLSIEGELAVTTPADMQAHHTEVRLSRYRRSFTLSKELDAGRVDAELAQGILRVRIPKAAHAQPRKIEVRVA